MLGKCLILLGFACPVLALTTATPLQAEELERTGDSPPPQLKRRDATDAIRTGPIGGTIFMTDIEGNMKYVGKFIKEMERGADVDGGAVHAKALTVVDCTSGADVLAKDIEQHPNPCFKLAEGYKLVFGGDSVDQRHGSMRVPRMLAIAKLQYPDRVTIVLGNRDLNKLRVPVELDMTRYPLMDSGEDDRDNGNPGWNPAPSYAATVRDAGSFFASGCQVTEQGRLEQTANLPEGSKLLEGKGDCLEVVWGGEGAKLGLAPKIDKFMAHEKDPAWERDALAGCNLLKEKIFASAEDEDGKDFQLGYLPNEDTLANRVKWMTEASMGAPYAVVGWFGEMALLKHGGVVSGLTSQADFTHAKRRYRSKWEAVVNGGPGGYHAEKQRPASGKEAFLDKAAWCSAMAETVAKQMIKSMKPEADKKAMTLEELKAADWFNRPFMYTLITLGELAAVQDNVFYAHGGPFAADAKSRIGELPCDKRAPPPPPPGGAMIDEAGFLKDWLERLKGWQHERLSDWSKAVVGTESFANKYKGLKGPDEYTKNAPITGPVDGMGSALANAGLPTCATSVVMGGAVTSNKGQPPSGEQITAPEAKGKRLIAAGVTRLVVGHQPAGQTPLIARYLDAEYNPSAEDKPSVPCEPVAAPDIFQIIAADTTYSCGAPTDRVLASPVVIDADGTWVWGTFRDTGNGFMDSASIIKQHDFFLPIPGAAKSGAKPPAAAYVGFKTDARIIEGIDLAFTEKAGQPTTIKTVSGGGTNLVLQQLGPAPRYPLASTAKKVDEVEAECRDDAHKPALLPIGGKIPRNLPTGDLESSNPANSAAGSLESKPVDADDAIAAAADPDMEVRPYAEELP